MSSSKAPSILLLIILQQDNLLYACISLQLRTPL